MGSSSLAFASPNEHGVVEAGNLRLAPWVERGAPSTLWRSARSLKLRFLSLRLMTAMMPAIRRSFPLLFLIALLTACDNLGGSTDAEPAAADSTGP